MVEQQLPTPDADGLLPNGVHDCTLEEVEQRFGSFQRSDRRCRLFVKLKDFVEEIKKWLPGAEVLIDGSFVMDCVDSPNDIDLVLVLPADWDLDANDIRPAEYNLMSSRRVRQKYAFDMQPAISGSDAEQELTAFFQQTNPKWNHELNRQLSPTKGIVRIVP